MLTNVCRPIIHEVHLGIQVAIKISSIPSFIILIFFVAYFYVVKLSDLLLTLVRSTL